MYRESDEICNELDQAPDEIKDIKFRERWECLSKEASEQVYEIMHHAIPLIINIINICNIIYLQLLDILHPRLIDP